MITAGLHLLEVLVLAAWLYDVDARLRRQENPYR